MTEWGLPATYMNAVKMSQATTIEEMGRKTQIDRTKKM